MGKKLAAGFLVVFIVPFVIIGAGTLIYSAYQILHALPTKNWIPVPAIITECRIISDYSEETVTEKVLISYTYHYEGKPFVGHRIAVGYSTNNIENHQELYHLLENAKKIVVYVNPRQPKEAVVIPGTNNSVLFAAIFSIMWNSFLAAFAIPYFLSRKQGVNELMLNDSNGE